jgi:diguanylate cyclase (GGDEF)-like protein
MSVGELARPARVLSADTGLDEVDQLFRTEPALSGVVITGEAGTGLLMRNRLAALPSRPFERGSACWACQRVADATDWAPLRVAAADSVVAVAEQLRSRPTEQRFDDVLVDLGGVGIGQVLAADLFDTLTSQLSRCATHDRLTGLVNRTQFLQLLTAACRKPTDETTILAIIDLDGLERVNDEYGYVVGDAVLRRVAHQLTAAAGPGDTVARLGDDEFCVLSRARSHESATVAAELGRRCQKAVAAPQSAAEPGGRQRASVGVAVARGDADPATLLSAAHTGVYRAKQAGGDRVEVTFGVKHCGPLDVAMPNRSVADAIHDGELRLWYQPVVRVSDRSVASIEALVRWAHPTMGLLTPDRFLPGARRGGHSLALDRWVLAQACSDFATLHRELGHRAPDRVAVNLTPATLATDFDHLVETALADAGLAPTRLVVELPEDADLEMLTNAAPRLDRLRRTGVSVILDDVGAGSTTLSHLSTLTLDGLKVDAAFINRMLRNSRYQTIVKLLADVGHGLELPVTAEGVENADQLTALAQFGIEYAQGYYLGRPCPITTLTAPLQSPLDARGLSDAG